MERVCPKCGTWVYYDNGAVTFNCLCGAGYWIWKKEVYVLNKKTVFNDIFKITEAWIQFDEDHDKKSEPVRRLVFERGDSAAALLWHRERQEFLLVEQFRFPTFQKNSGWTTEIVAGVVEPGEHPVVTIQREILEETGYQVQKLNYITVFYPSPGGSSERVFCYFAEVDEADKVSAGGGALEEQEDIRIVELSEKEMEAALKQGKIIDAKTIIALQWWQMNKRNLI